MDKNFTPPKPREMFAQEPLSVRIRNWRPTVMQIALAISLSLHAVLLGVRFVDPEDFNRVFQDTPLEIVLVNARSNEAPPKTQAQAIAQANLAGGGEVDKGMATSPLMASPIDQDGDASENLQREIQQQLQEQQQLLTRVKSELANFPALDPKKASATPQEIEAEERRKQMVKSLAALEKTIQEQNSRPRRRYVSPSTREEVYAVWGDQLRQKIEAKGTRSYPTIAGKPMHGSLYVNIVVNAKGHVLEVSVKQSSGNAILDQRAVAIARQAGPFQPFTHEMRLKADELEWTWHFAFENAGLTATAFGNR